jgi:hypothetical protein
MGTPAAKKVKASKAGNTGRSLPERDAFKPRVTPTPDPRLSRSFEYGVAILECFTGERQTLGIAEMADMATRLATCMLSCMSPCEWPWFSWV